MIRGRLPGVSTILLTVVSLGLGANVVISDARSPGDGDGDGDGRQVGLEISTIDVRAGVGDANLSVHDMVPGDVVTAAVTVANSGRQTMTYTMSHGAVSTDGAALAAALVLTIKTIGSSCEDDDGSTLFTGPLDAAVLGSEGHGRPLAAATAEILCFRVELPRDADDGLQGAASTITLTFGSTLQAAGP